MFLLIDNYDSFTYNLVQAFMQLGHDPVVVKNNDPRLPEMALQKNLSMVCLSPGPSNPTNAGFCLEFLAKLPKHIPVLGVCLGHQILGHFAGAKVVVNHEIMHGKQSQAFHTGTGIFSGLASPMTIGRYHSLTVLADECPKNLIVTARTEDNGVQGINYKDRPWAGVQFHPESILTPEGKKLLANFPNALIDESKKSKESDAINMENKTILLEETPTSLILENLAQGKDLTEKEATDVFTALMEGELSPAQSGALLMGLRAKGETPEEVSAAVAAVLEKAVSVPCIEAKSIDVVGTGGDAKNSFNCSTATALVLAALGHNVLKHGNRSVSSRCGSADVLETLGVPLNIAASSIPTMLEKDKFVFLFAPQFHPAFRHVVPIRRDLGIRTFFNFLGPLVNPASPTHHLFGVAKPELIPLMAGTLAKSSPQDIGAVVYGYGGYDELTTLGVAKINFVRQGVLSNAELDPAEYGFSPCKEEELSVTGKEDSLHVLKKILEGKGPKPMQEMLAFNVGLALYLLDLPERKESIDPQKGYDTLRMTECMEKAKEAVNKGVAKKFITAYNAA